MLKNSDGTFHIRAALFLINDYRDRQRMLIHQFIVFLTAIFFAISWAHGSTYPSQSRPSYALSQIDQFHPSSRPDILPNDSVARRLFARMIAIDATVYGLPSVLQYREMFQQAIDISNTRYVGFNRFSHDRDLAGPGYKAFKSPNSDTLYSNAWLDLTNGPVVIEVPDVPLKYFTLNFFDMYGNPSNIGTRTFGSKAGRYLVAPANWQGVIPQGVVLFRVATPQTWILMRVFAQSSSEVISARKIQDSVKIIPAAPSIPKDPFPLPDVKSAVGFFKILDYVLRTNGHPDQEDALIYRFRALGVGGQVIFDPTLLDPEILAGMEEGFRDAMKIIVASRSQLGSPTGTGWNKTEKGKYGFNYLNRALINYVGLGANVEEENLSFNTFFDENGQALNGSEGSYTLELQPPPVEAFWSVTLYEASNFELYPNEIGRYLINDRTAGVKVGLDGALSILIQHERPGDVSNWLPAPNGPFFIAIRSYLPKVEMIRNGWHPKAIKKKSYGDKK